MKGDYVVGFVFHRVEGGAPIKSWTKGVELEEEAKVQLENVSKLPFIFKHLAVMPDVHWGVGATVGSVIATKGAIVPAAVGVDIGCGMIAAKTHLKASDLPDNLHQLRMELEAVVPHGRSKGVTRDNDVGSWQGSPSPRVKSYVDNAHLWRETFQAITDKHPKLTKWANQWPNQLGTLGTGNHFIEICLDEEQCVWIMLHSGSRGVGNAIGSYFIERAKEHMRLYFINLPDDALAYLPEKTQDFKDYLEAVEWAQDYAMTSRYLMLYQIQDTFTKWLGKAVTFSQEIISCHHNYVARENHFSQNVIVTRKGAVRARTTDLGIIPGSMGTGSFIVQGLGNPDSFQSCSHGAGRTMSRGEAKKKITLEDHARAMKGIEARLDADVIDESPAAYKDIGAVMAAQEDLVSIKYRLHQILNIKG